VVLCLFYQATNDVPKLEGIIMSEKERIANLLVLDQPYRNNRMYQEQLVEIQVEGGVDREITCIMEYGNVTFSSVLNY